MSLKLVSLVLSYVPLIAKKPLFDFVISITHSVLIRSFPKLANNVDMDELLDEFKNYPDWVINSRVTSL